MRSEIVGGTSDTSSARVLWIPLREGDGSGDAAGLALWRDALVVELRQIAVARPRVLGVMDCVDDPGARVALRIPANGRRAVHRRRRVEHDVPRPRTPCVLDEVSPVNLRVVAEEDVEVVAATVELRGVRDPVARARRAVVMPDAGAAVADDRGAV